jgi:hypothetical protein
MVGTSGCYDKGSYGNLLSWQVCCNGYCLTSDQHTGQNSEVVLLSNFANFFILFLDAWLDHSQGGYPANYLDQ